MELKDGIIILINLAILATVIAAAVYIFQIGNGDRTVKCGAVDMFGDGCGVYEGDPQYDDNCKNSPEKDTACESGCATRLPDPLDFYICCDQECCD